LHSDLAHLLGPERFLREIRVSARLQHPHILSVLDSGDVGGTGDQGGALLWYTMPLRRDPSRPTTARRATPLDEACGLPARRRMPCTSSPARVIHRDIGLRTSRAAEPARWPTWRGGRYPDGIGGPVGLTETGLAVGTP
jgi:serine/threonine-protein kinase